jgi:tetratricopeptide (TPR) repeat protein
MSNSRSRVWWCGCFALAALAIGSSACAGSGAASGATTTPAKHEVEFEELRINARAKEGGGYEFESYDADDLFKRATEFSNARKCDEAVAMYDRIVSEFASSQYVSAALYNAGLCLQATGNFAAAAEHYQNVRKLRPGSDDVKDASFLLAEVLIQLEHWADAQTLVDELLAREDLTQDERLEGLARRSQAQLGAGDLDEAERAAQSGLSYFRTRPKAQPVRDEFFAAACNYVLAETFRSREESLTFPDGLESQKQVLIRRAQLLLQAQREYFNTISFQNLDNLHWAASSGYRIGHMYDELWQSVMSAPVPANLRGREGEAIYHQELGKLIKPLIRHAIRYWEMTQLFIERTGTKSPWADKIKTDLARVRALLLEQPGGEGGLPEAGTQPPAAATTIPSGSAESPQPSASTQSKSTTSPGVDGPPKEPTRGSRSALQVEQ